MKSSVILLVGVLIASVVGMVNFDNVSAQSLEDDLPMITQFTTQKSSYTFDDAIVVSGNIENYWPDDPAQIKLNLPNGNVLLEFDTSIDTNGDFTFEIIAGGVGWTEEGTYTLNVIHADDAFVDENISFEYTNLIQGNNKLETIYGQLGAQTQSDVQSLDVKISREQSQYHEYHKQYEYYEDKLSQEEDPKLAPMISKLNSLDKKINSLIEDRNMLVFLNEEFNSEIIEEDVESNLIAQVEEQPEKELFCFLFWCW